MINAAAAQTTLGGSLMPAPVVEAMQAAAGRFVHLPQLHDRIGARLAELTRNDAASVCCGAAAGILTAVSACVTGSNHGLAAALPDIAGKARTEVVVFRNQDNGFLSAVRMAGATIVSIEDTKTALATALSDRTAAVLWFAGAVFPESDLLLPHIVEIAHAAGTPVIVDAADQIPPIENLWRYTRQDGADLAIFSGGKGLRGPQSSGLIVGRTDLVEACRVNSGPQHSIARPAKVGKEEMMGLLAAVEWSLRNENADAATDRRQIANYWLDGLAELREAVAHMVESSHSGQPIPRVIVRMADGDRRNAAVAALWDQDPHIAVLSYEDDGFALNPHFVEPTDAAVVLGAVREIVGH